MADPNSMTEREAAVERFFGSAMKGDWETFRACFAESAEVFQNGEQLTVDQLVKWSSEGIEGVRYFDARRTATDEVVIEQHRAEITLPGGKKFTPPEICVVFRFDAKGRFSRVDEYAPLSAVPR